jgi:hypothetical protein
MNSFAVGNWDILEFRLESSPYFSFTVSKLVFGQNFHRSGSIAFIVIEIQSLFYAHF